MIEKSESLGTSRCVFEFENIENFDGCVRSDDDEIHNLVRRVHHDDKSCSDDDCTVESTSSAPIISRLH